ncbi:MAG TPA: tetratricopeptide repeat-containing glycosyltransferase family protein [Bryobacteraceae bacterium]|nr:tetratricopeptide repeat-containing glycosyltransferase family protein [Bryobacteraceae bacterium]
MPFSPGMNGVVRLREPDGSVRQLSVADAVAEASNDLQRGSAAHALRLLDQAVHRAPQAPAVRYLLGVAQLRQNQRDLAISNLERAVRGDARNIDYLAALGEALIPERPLDAIAYFATAIELGAKRPDVYSLLASILINMRRPADALNACDLGLTACGDAPEILGNRGLALRDLARYEEALHYLKKTESLLPRDYRVLVGIGNILSDLGRLAEAKDYFMKAAAVRPGDPVCRYNLALALLLAGNLRDGFREYEWRWENRQFASHRPRFAQPLWNGAELAGRHLLLSFEQGAGDTIQFARYVQFAKERGARVTMLVQSPLRRLMTWLTDEVTVTDTLPAAFDVYCPLGSLPYVAGTGPESIPAPAQFEVPAITRWQWHARLGERNGARIAIVWAGAAGHLNDHNRSLPFQRLAPLFDAPGAEWFSLQVGPPSAQLAGSNVRDLAPFLADYAETAAALQQMDLVITADTSVAHLAGSLGVPAWVLIPFAPDWRWMRDRDDSPWYPSMKLYRQSAAGDWDTVLRNVRTDLNAWLQAELEIVEASAA